VSRVVVIGAGVGGLVAAARLAAAGHRVRVFEQAEVVGGKLGQLSRTVPTSTGGPGGQFRFDTGPSLLTLPQVFAEFFTATGSTLADELDLVALDPLIRHVFPDGSVLDSGGGPDGFADRIGAAFGARAAADWRALSRRAARIWAASWRDVLTRPMDAAAMRRLVWHLDDLRAIAPGRTLRGLGRSYLGDARLRVLLDRYATYAGADPRRAPAALAAIVHAEHEFGGWYPRGGLGTLVDALLRRCATLGVEIHTSTAVDRIDTAAGAVTGVRLADGAGVPADVVVANADAQAVYTRLLPTPAQAARLRERSLAGFVLLLGVRGRTPGLAHHTVFFPPVYEDEFNAIFRRGEPVADPTVFVTVADDPGVRPPGHEAWFLLVNAPAQNRFDWRAPDVAPRYADQVLATLAARGLDVRDRVLFREIRTPADLETATATPGGAIYGTPTHHLLRPPNRTDVRGLYLVGGSVHPGGGLPMVTLSAKIVADLIGPA
jgi:phytoene desaturase